MSKTLTAEYVLARTKSDSLESIKNLNLWNNDIEDLKLLKQMPNIEVLSLSVNKIYTLKDFEHCKKLQELYLRKNNINDITEIRYLVNLPNLRVLWLWDNPIANLTYYREYIIKLLPNLVKLDNNNITEEDKTLAAKFDLNSVMGPSFEKENIYGNQQTIIAAKKKSDAPTQNLPKQPQMDLRINIERVKTDNIVREDCDDSISANNRQRRDADKALSRNKSFEEYRQEIALSQRNPNLLNQKASNNVQQHQNKASVNNYYGQNINQSYISNDGENHNTQSNKQEINSDKQNNILSAIHILMKELDDMSLISLKNDIEIKLAQRSQQLKAKKFF